MTCPTGTDKGLGEQVGARGPRRRQRQKESPGTPNMYQGRPSRTEAGGRTPRRDAKIARDTGTEQSETNNTQRFGFLATRQQNHSGLKSPSFTAQGARFPHKHNLTQLAPKNAARRRSFFSCFLKARCFQQRVGSGLGRFWPLGEYLRVAPAAPPPLPQSGKRGRGAAARAWGVG